MRQRGSYRAGTFSAIKAAGIRLIYQHGYEAMTLRMLAHSVGLESGSLYYHIKDKQDFLFRLLKEIMEGNIATLSERLRGVEDPVEQMRVLMRFFITHQWEKKEEAFIVGSEVRSLTPENYQVISALGRAFQDRVEEIIKQGVAAGKFRVKNTTVATIAVCDILGGPARWYYPKELLVLDEIVEMISDMIFQLLGMRQQGEKAVSPRPESTVARAADLPARSGSGGQPKAAAVMFPRASLWVR